MGLYDEPKTAKKPWQSKTHWSALLVALAPFIPGVGPVIAKHPEVVLPLVAGVFSLLRQVTSKNISLK